jgi:hypothetical protein
MQFISQSFLNDRGEANGINNFFLSMAEYIQVHQLLPSKDSLQTLIEPISVLVSNTKTPPSQIFALIYHCFRGHFEGVSPF